VVTSEDGRYQFFHRPHHFAAETTVSIARAALSNEHTGASQGHTAEVIAAAKRDLEPGDRIDGGGGATVYGVAEDAGRAAENAYVPFELLRGAEVVEPIRVDEYVTREQVELETGGFLHSLREMQDGM
jgi:predicted homoserine dehydrogenase-like protein